MNRGYSAQLQSAEQRLEKAISQKDRVRNPLGIREHVLVYVKNTKISKTSSVTIHKERKTHNA